MASRQFFHTSASLQHSRWKVGGFCATNYFYLSEMQLFNRELGTSKEFCRLHSLSQRSRSEQLNISKNVGFNND